MRLILNLLLLSFSFSASTALAAAKCHSLNSQASIIVTDNRSILIDGLESLGVANGIYKCKVESIFMNIASTSICANQDGEKLTMILSEMVNKYGVREASAKLTKNKALVFDSSCFPYQITQ